MNVNFGLFPELEPGSIVRPKGSSVSRGKDKAIAKKKAMSARALSACKTWLETA